MVPVGRAVAFPANAVAFTSLISYQLIKPTVPLSIGLGLALLVIDVAAWWVVSRMFDRELLVTGHRASAATGTLTSSA